LTLSGVFILLHLYSGEGVPISSTWATTAFGTAWPFHFFTVAFSADVTGAEGGLVHYSLLSYYFYRAYK
jgi:hypothetical protein